MNRSCRCIALGVLVLLGSCDVLTGELEPSSVNPGSDSLVGGRWASEGLQTPQANESFTEVPTAQWANYQPVVDGNPNLYYLLHIGRRDVDDEYEAVAVVPYITGTTFDMKRLPVDPDETYYISVATRSFTIWNDEIDDIQAVPRSKLDPPGGVFDPDLLENSGSEIRPRYDTWAEAQTFPIPFTYTGPSYRYDHPVTGPNVTIDSPNSATVTWTDPAAAGGFDGVHVTRFPGPATPTVVDTGVGSITLNDLNPFFAYVVWIQTVADNGDISDPVIVTFSPGDGTINASDEELPTFWLSTPNGLVPGERLRVRGLLGHTPELSTFDYRKTVSGTGVSQGDERDWHARWFD